jgi:luciferase family oxidoreductase group 1
VTSSLTFSVLDLVLVRVVQSTGDAIAATVALARTADELGFRRYWVAEHHNAPAVAATNPPMLIAMIAAATQQIRVGSGGVMLPNHAPLVVAEQFALLEAAHPDRIDLGLGRAAGTDPATAWALRHGAGGVEVDAASHFPEYVDDVIAMMKPEGVGLAVSGRTHQLRATPSATSTADVWLLGSSSFSARLAAAKGLPYVFAHWFAESGTADALALYREGFQPSDSAKEPKTFLTVNVCVAPTDEEAHRRALPQQLSVLALQTRGQLSRQLSIEEAEQVKLPAGHAAMIDEMRNSWVIGTPAEALRRIRQLAATYAVDEVMLHPVAGSFAAEGRRVSTGRQQSLRLLAAQPD